jgi:ammonium transporter, Amt family
MSALLIGLIAGVFCFFMVFKVKGWFGYDDSLDAFGVHGAGGTLGALLTGVFAASAINPVFDAGNALPTGAIDGHWGQVLNQRPASPSPGASPSSARWCCSSSSTR